MGCEWDSGVPGVAFWRPLLAAGKPGAHLLAFGGTRTFHRLICAIEDAGWEIRDCLMWLYGSGFPKSLDVSKAIDKAAGAERRITGPDPYARNHPNPRGAAVGQNYGTDHNPARPTTAPATAAAKQWDGWGTALKPAWEPITLARKPLDGTVAANMLAHGCGGLNIDRCRVGAAPLAGHGGGLNRDGRKYGSGHGIPAIKRGSNFHRGRFPANVIHDGSEEVLAEFPLCDVNKPGKHGYKESSGYGGAWGDRVPFGYDDTGSSARFFYCAKADKKDRGEGNNHPTVKPTALLRYLCRLITPAGRTVLDPFMGSGTTGVACVQTGRQFVGIEIDRGYFDIAVKRIDQERRQGRMEFG